MARRMIELMEEPVAVAFSRDNKLRYLIRSKSFPYCGLRTDDRMPPLPQLDPGSIVSSFEEAAPALWRTDLGRGYRADSELLVQTHPQANSHAMSLLDIEGRAVDDVDEDTGIEAADERFSRFSPSG